MLGLFKTRPPLRTAQRMDLELLMRRTLDVIGMRRVRQCEVVESIDALQLASADSQQLLDSIRNQLRDRLPQVDAALQYVIVDAASPEQPAARYQPQDETASARIMITRETLTDPLRSLMESAYQHSTHFWHQLPEPSVLDTHPRTTHLLPVACGLGVLASDASLYDHQWSHSGFTGWSLSRCGYYTAEEIGYAMALLARVRGEDNPTWLESLRLDARQTATRAMAYFQKHASRGGTLLLDASSVPSTQADPAELAHWLRGEDACFSLAAAHALWQLPSLSPLVVEAAVAATHGSDPDVVPLAIRLLGKTRGEDDTIQQRLQRLAGSSSPVFAWAAIQAIEQRGGDVSAYRRQIQRLIDRQLADPIELASLVERQGKAFASLAPRVCRQLRAAVQQGDLEAGRAWAASLRKIAPDARHAIESTVPANEVRKRMLECLDQST